jgi:hypothetical protein
MARFLEPAGEAGMSHLRLDEIGSGRPEVLATGDAGTVYLCHPSSFTPRKCTGDPRHVSWRTAAASGDHSAARADGLFAG